MNIFYSWQSDYNSKTNRYFIEDCIKNAIKNVNKNLELEVTLDRDTKGEIGTPDIADVIFKKIDKSALFIADISITSRSDNSKSYPNSNVLIELGYAAAKLGWENIICIYNSSCGVGVENLPFDIRSRRILVYNLEMDGNKAEARSNLVSTLEKVLSEYDMKKLLLKNRIKKRFTNEDLDIVNIAITEGEYWEFELFAKLLSIRLDNLDEKYNRLMNGLYVYEKINCSNQEFFDKSLNFHSNNIYMLQILDKIINKEIVSSIGEPGESGDQISIINLIDNLREVLDQVIETEVKIHQLNIENEVLLRLRSCMLGMYENFSLPLRQLISQFEKVYLGYYKENEMLSISLKFESPASYDQIHNILEEIRMNPYILKE